MTGAEPRPVITERPVEDAAATDGGRVVLDRLSWRPHGRHRPTLAEISLTVGPGERVLLVGASGAGKSTLLRAIAGLLDDSLGELDGSVTIDGRAPQEIPGQVGLLLQDPTHALVCEYAGRDAAFGPENLAQPRSQVQHRATSALGEVGFPYDAGHHTTELSGGESQRLALAGALALGPRLLLLDEPTSMLDPDAADGVRTAVLRSVAARGLSLVVVEHRLDGWVEHCDRLIVLTEEGRLLADGPVDGVLRERRDALIAAGIWVPGAPAPEPVQLALPPSRLGGTAAESTRPDTAPRIRAQRLTVTSPDRRRELITALDLVLGPGQALAVTGPSGSGKSTLLRTLIGLQPAGSGSVLLRADGAELVPAGELARHSTRLAGSVGLLAQQAGSMITRRTVRDEVLATSVALWSDQPELLRAAEHRADAALSALGLERLRGADPYQISGGEQRRMILASVITHAPGLLVADEPTVGQDRHTWAAVTGVLAAARREGAAVVASTHDALLTEQLGARLSLARSHQLSPTPDHRIRPVIEPGLPVAARGNPLALLAAGLGAVIGSFFVDSVTIGLIGLLVVAALTPVAVRRPRTLLRLLPVGLAAITVGWSALLFSPGGWWQPEQWPIAAREVLRICYLVIPGALLLASLRPSALADALGQRLRLPHRVVMASAAGLLRLDQMFEDWRTLREVRQVRGLAPGRSPVARVRHLASLTVAMLVSMLRSAQQMAISMDARGFAAGWQRTYALESRWRRWDWLGVITGVLFAVLPGLTGILLPG